MEEKFMKMYILNLYKKGYCYFDVSKDYLDDYLFELKKILDKKNMIEKYNLKNIFRLENDNYMNFINLILKVTSSPKHSFIDSKAEIIMLNIPRNIILQINEDIAINEVTDHMIDYINFNIKIKTYKNNYI